MDGGKHSRVTKAALIAAARPNFMKIAPVLRALEARDVECSLVHTGQHYDPQMSDVFFADLGLRQPDHHLGIGSGSHAEQTGRTMIAFEPLLEELGSEVVITVGDVNATLACSLVAAKAGALVAHVEAGLRSRDWSMPEEVNRVATDRVSDYLLAPSPDAVDNLRAEGYRDDQIHLVGNVMVDSLLANLERARAGTTLADLGLETGGYGVVTMHRPANVDDTTVLLGLMAALDELTSELPLVFPVHPRTRSRLAAAGYAGDVRLIEPQGYLRFLALQAGARIVLTDSGGIQEETTVLGVPCLTLRDNTERPITVDQGTNRLVGRDPARIVAAARATLLDPPPRRRPELWDGHAADRIAEVIVHGGRASDRSRPTNR
jgi:UDP-N-acetylglucosamine 2-epimerase (non-hydrolysing)